MRSDAVLRLIVNPDPIEEDAMTENITTEAPQADCADCGRKSHPMVARLVGIIAGAAVVALVVIFLRLPRGDDGDQAAEAE